MRRSKSYLYKRLAHKRCRICRCKILLSTGPYGSISPKGWVTKFTIFISPPDHSKSSIFHFFEPFIIAPVNRAIMTGAHFTPSSHYSMNHSCHNGWPPVATCGLLWPPVTSCGILWPPVAWPAVSKSCFFLLKVFQKVAHFEASVGGGPFRLAGQPSQKVCFSFKSLLKSCSF